MDRSFLGQWVRISLDALRDFIHAAVDRNLFQVVKVVLGVVRTLVQVPVIWRHRQLSYRPGHPWLLGTTGSLSDQLELGKALGFDELNQ
jgi:hypothetical protein